MTGRLLQEQVASVVRNGNCSGCGACALMSDRISMTLSRDGYARPLVADSAGADDRAVVREFRAACPGLALSAPSADREDRWHRTFGSYRSAWQGWATDETTRRAGSSAGVLTALSTWILESGASASVLGAGAGPQPRLTVPVRMTSRAEALGAAGSRYAPVGTAAAAADVLDGRAAVVGKPCEVSALRRLAEARGSAITTPVLSFFCAGTPSQDATDGLVRELGADPETLVELRYRGNGWPGEFTARDAEGRVGSTGYEESWGRHLGRQLQWRCKLCPDGTGEHADISVGDFWQTDEKGYPRFMESAGNSVIIVRTALGARLLESAVAAGRITIESVSLDEVERVQPLQRERRRTLVGRLIGRLAAGKAIPRFRGYRLRTGVRDAPRATVRAARGTRSRSRA